MTINPIKLYTTNASSTLDLARSNVLDLSVLGDITLYSTGIFNRSRQTGLLTIVGDNLSKIYFKGDHWRFTNNSIYDGVILGATSSLRFTVIHDKIYVGYALGGLIGDGTGLDTLVTLPTFDDGIVGSLLLQHLFDTNELIDVVKADGYTYVKDAVGNGTDRLSKRGFARHYDGINGVTTIPHSASLTFGNGTTDQPFSISAWFNMTDATSFTIITKGSATNEDFIFYSDGTDNLALILGSSTVSANRIGRATTTLTAYENQDILNMIKSND